jgi:hypothetical protein
MDFGKILARGLIQMGIGGPQLRNNAGTIEARNAANNGFAPLTVQSLRFESELNFAGRRWTLGTAPHTSPTLGDRFRECDVNGRSIYGWDWEWNGGYWLSPQYRQKMHAIGANSVDHAYYLHLDQSLDTFIEALETTSLIVTTNNGTNYWTFTLSHVLANNTSSIITTLTTASNPASNWIVNRANLSQHLDTSALGARILLVFAAKTNAPGACYLTPEITYRYARP